MDQSRLISALKLRDDPVCQYFAEFDAPLVERIDVPDSTLDKNLVLIECNQLTQRLWCQPCSENGVRWMISLKGAVWNLEGCNTVCHNLFCRLPKCQGLGLSEEVRHQQIVVGLYPVQRLT